MPPVEMVSVGIRSLTDGVVCEIRLIAPANAFRGEMATALNGGLRRIYERIDAHYAGTVAPTPWVGAVDA